MTGLEIAVAWIVANPGAAAVAGGFVAQGLSWIVKKSPWGWDDSLFGWAVKNKAGITTVAKAAAKLKK